MGLYLSHPILQIDAMKTKRKSKKQKSGVRSQKSELGGRKRPPLERMKKIFGLLQDGKYPNSSSVAKEFRVAVKTARRDFDFMRDRWELPIAYDELKHGFYFTTPVSRVPGVPVTEKELFALCVAHKAIEQYQGTALQQPLELAFQKCMGQLDDQERFTLQNLDDVLSFRPFAPEDPDLRLFEIITEAIRERRVLQFEYRKPGAKAAERRQVFPYHLMQFTNRWYLLGHDRKRGANHGDGLGEWCDCFHSINTFRRRHQLRSDISRFYIDRRFGDQCGRACGSWNICFYRSLDCPRRGHVQC